MQTRTVIAWGALFCGLAARAPDARADHVVGTRGVVTDKVHRVEIDLQRGYATLTVQRTFHNEGSRHDQALAWITAMPEGAVATRLRTMAMKDGIPTWYEGELLEAELAAKRYRELTGIGGYYPKDPALLSWRHPGELALQVFPIDPRGDKTVSYTLLAPTRYENGHDVLDVPAMGGKLAAIATLVPATNGEALYINDLVAPPDLELPLQSMVRLSRARHQTAPIVGALARADTGKRTLVRASFELAPKLSELPKSAAVVVVLDSSASLDATQRAAEVSAAHAYLRNLPDANVQIVTFARKPKARFAKPVPTEQALKELEKLTLASENGSNLDRALLEANRWLESADKSAPRRIVVFTDLLGKLAVTPPSLQTIAKDAGAIIHFVRASSTHGSAFLQRNDGDRWAAVPRSTGGLLWDARAGSDLITRLTGPKVFEELARPVRIDELKLEGMTISESTSLPSTMPEGSGFSDIQLVKTAGTSFTVRGELWSTPVRATIAETDAESRRWAALVFGTELRDQLSDPEMMKLAMYGKAVSPVTSYLAIEPGVRPSTEGLEEGGSIGLGAFGTVGHGFGGGGYGHGVGTLDPKTFLRRLARKAVDECGGKSRSAELNVEVTLSELVDVHVKLRGERTPLIETCAEELLWASEMPSDWRARWTSYSLAVD